MAKSTRIETPEEAEVREAAEDLAQLNAEEGGEIYRAIDEMRGSAGTTVVIVKLSPPEEKGHCDSIPVAEFTMDELKKRYGAGSYKIRIRGPKGWVPGGGTVFISSAGIKKPNGTSGASGEAASFFEFLQKQESERREKTSRLLELGIPALGTIIAAIVNRPQGTDVAALITALKPAPGPTLADLSQTMINFKALAAPEKPAGDPVETVLKVFEAARELGDGGGSKGSGSNWVDIVRDLIKEVPQVAGPVLRGLQQRAAIRAGAQQTAPTVITAPQPVAPSAPAVAISASPSAEPAAQVSAGSAAPPRGNGADMLMFFKPMLQEKLKIIAGWAQQGKDAQMYAELFLREHVPSSVQDYLPPAKALEYLNHEKWFETVCEWEPSLTNVREWCTTFRDELIYWISESMKPTEDAPTDEGGYLDVAQ